jgi:PAS domain S-box-containing protein
VKQSFDLHRAGKVALVCLVEGAVLWGILKGVKLQSRHIDTDVSDVSDLKDPSPFRVALLGHLDKISLSLSAYLRSPEPTLLQQIDASRKDFENSLPEFEHQNKKLFPPAASEEIRNAYDAMKSSLDEAVEVSARRSERRTAAEGNFKQMLYLIDDRLRPLLRKDAAKDRLESIIGVENQLRAWQQNLEQSWIDPSPSIKALANENNSKGQSLLDLHEQIMLASAEKKGVRSVAALWRLNDDIARQIFALETVQNQAMDRLKIDREKLTKTLSDLLPAMRPEDMERKKQAILRTIRFRLFTAGAFGLVGVLSFAAAVVLVYRQLLPPTEQRWKSTFEIDMKGTIINWSPAAKKLYGYDPIEIRGQSVAMLFANESEINQLLHQMQSAEQTAFNMMHKAKGGKTLHMRVQFLRMTDGSGNLSAIGLACTKR